MHTRILTSTTILYCLGLMFMTTLFSSCGNPPIATEIRLELNDNPNAPLAGILHVQTNKPTYVRLRISDETRDFEVTPDQDLQTVHETLVLGLRANTTHQVTPTIYDSRGNSTELAPMEITTPPLPDDFPPIKLTSGPSSDMEPGITMLNFFRWESAFQDDTTWGLAAAVDHEGEVIWYLQTNYFIEEPRRSRDGSIMIVGGIDGRLRKFDMLGNQIKEWHNTGSIIGDLAENSIPVENDIFHHDVLELKTGNFLGLGLRVSSIDDFPLEYPPGIKRGHANVAGDLILEFSPDGKTQREYPVVDILDPTRLGDGSLETGHYELIYKNEYDSLTLPKDISHSNAIYYIEEEDAVIVSSNFQCALFKVDMSTGELLWILGDPEGWKEPWSDKLLKPKGDLTWPCHQHGVEITPTGRLLMYDNGGGRFIPPQKPQPEEERYSRVVEYVIDEEAGTVEEVWSYGPDEELFISVYICDADYLPTTGNILVTDGGRFEGPDGEIRHTFGGHQWARIFEIDHDSKEKLWEITIKDSIDRFSVYRAQRFKSIYPKLDIPTG